MNLQMSTLRQLDKGPYTAFRQRLQQSGIYAPDTDNAALQELLDNCDNYHADNKAWVIKNNDEVVAHIVIHLDVTTYGSDKPFLTITHLDVAKPYVRMGLATKLFNRVFLAAIEKSLDHIDMTVSKSDTDKVSFLLKMGAKKSISFFNKREVYTYGVSNKHSQR